MILPKEFSTRMKIILGNEYSEFEEALHEDPVTSIRLHPVKSEHSLALFEKVPWHPDGYYLKDRPIFVLDPYFHAGHYYVQDASSMFINFIVDQIDLPDQPKILDLCSAPGGKSTLLQSKFADNGIIHSHEFDPYRYGILKQNVQRWGYSNNILTHGPLKQFTACDIKYDLILIDAPCSGEGMFRKEQDAVDQWNVRKIEQCVNMQQSILSIADALCNSNGYIIYSTCTWNQDENEKIIESYINSGKYYSQQIPNHYHVTETNETCYTYRLMPHKIKGEGLTVSVMRKQSESTPENHSIKPFKLRFDKPREIMTDWISHQNRFMPVAFKENYFCIPNNCVQIFEQLCQQISCSYLGIPFGHYKGIHFYPAHGLSQSIYLREEINALPLNYDEALEFLKALTPKKQTSNKSQWQLAKYNAANLGWLKNGGSGIKNYFPINLRIISY